ncbi:hypothetical protein [Microcoleus sp.]
MTGNKLNAAQPNLQRMRSLFTFLWIGDRTLCVDAIAPYFF